MDNDCSSQIIEDIKYKLFDDSDFNMRIMFNTWCGDGHSFIITDTDGSDYRITISKE